MWTYLSGVSTLGWVGFPESSGSSFNKFSSISISCSFGAGISCSSGYLVLAYPSSGSPIFSSISVHKISTGFVNTTTFLSEVVWVFMSLSLIILFSLISLVYLTNTSDVITELMKWVPSESMILKLSGKLTLIKFCLILQDLWRWWLVTPSLDCSSSVSQVSWLRFWLHLL